MSIFVWNCTVPLIIYVESTAWKETSNMVWYLLTKYNTYSHFSFFVLKPRQPATESLNRDLINLNKDADIYFKWIDRCWWPNLNIPVAYVNRSEMFPVQPEAHETKMFILYEIKWIHWRSQREYFSR